MWIFAYQWKWIVIDFSFNSIAVRNTHGDFCPFKLLICALWSRIWSILTYILWVIKKNGYSAVVRWIVLWKLVWSCWLMVLLTFLISLPILWIAVPPSIERRVLKSPAVFLNLSILISVLSVCFTYFAPLLFDACIFRITVTFYGLALLALCNLCHYLC